MQGCQSGQAVPQDGHGHTGPDTGLHWTGGDDDSIEILPPPSAEPTVNQIQHIVVQHAAEVISVDPLHRHHSNAIAVDEIVHVQQIILLNLRDAGSHPSHSGHGVFVIASGFVTLRGKNLHGDRQSESVCARRSLK